MAFISSWGQLIKRYIGTNVIFGSRATKLAGINDFGNLHTDAMIFTAPNIITFTNPLPNFLLSAGASPGKVFKVVNGGGTNNGATFRVVSILGNSITVSITAVQDFSGITEIDGRIWSVIDDPSIARSTSTGATMYNVHNRDASVLLNDASEVAYVFAEHYHDIPAIPDPHDADEIIFHLHNEMGERSMVTSSCSGVQLDIGPLAIVDWCGNVVKTDASLKNPVDLCYPYPMDCPGQTCSCLIPDCPGC